MGLSKADMICEMQVMVNEMGPMILESGIKHNYLDHHPDAILLPIEMIREAYRWIKNIFKTSYDDVMIIRKLLPEDMWKRYMAWGDFGEHREVVLLTEKLKIFKKAIVTQTKPDFYKKGLVNAEFKKLKKSESKARSKKQKDNGAKQECGQDGNATCPDERDN